MRRYVISAWTFDEDGTKIWLVGPDAHRRNWPVQISDVTSQPAGEIRADHGVLVLLTVWAYTHG